MLLQKWKAEQKSSNWNVLDFKNYCSHEYIYWLDTPGLFTPDFPLPFCLLCQEAKGLVFLLPLPVTEEQQWTRASKTVPSQGAARVIWGWFWCAPSATQNFWVCKCSSSSLCSSSILASLFISKEALQLDEEQSQPRAREEQWPKNRLQLVSQNLPWGCY